MRRNIVRRLLPKEAHAARRKISQMPERQVKPHNRTVKRHKNMLNDNRYCGDILVQLSAAESALSSFGYEILSDHFKTCVVENVKDGNTAILDEAVELIKKLK